MRKGLVRIAMEKRDIIVRKNSAKELSYKDIRKVGAFMLGNVGINILNTPVSFFLEKENGNIKEIAAYWGNSLEPQLTVKYQEKLSAQQVLKEVYQKIREY